MRKTLPAVGAAAVSVLLLGGCAAGTHPGAAAVVGDHEITVGDVDSVSKSVTSALGQPFTANLTLNELVNSALVEQVASKRSVEVSEAEIAAATKAVVSDPVAYGKFEADPVAKEFLRDVAAAAIGTIKLGGGTGITDPKVQDAQRAGRDIIRQESDKIGVSVAPRFGKWSEGAVDGKVSGSLSEESEQAKAKREATQQPQQPEG